MELFKNREKLKSKEAYPVPDFWKAGYFRLFISHITSDKAIAQGLKDKLSGFGISCFVAHADIEPTAEWLGPPDMLNDPFEGDFIIDNLDKYYNKYDIQGICTNSIKER